MASSVYSRTFQKAAELKGGQKKLARYLQVPLADVEKWIIGKDTPPIAIFLKAVDLVLEETSSSAGSDPGDPPAPRDCAGLGERSALL
jgi:hypothetical protein